MFSGSPRALDQTHYKTQHLHFPRRDWVGPPWHIDPTAARNFLATPLEAMMDLVFIIYIITNILVIYYVHRSRFLESVD